MAIVPHNTKSHHNLSAGDKVEVKSSEEGFLGSWHAGKIIVSSEDIDPQNDGLVTENEECEPMIDENAENNASALDLSNGSSPFCSGSNVRLRKKHTLKKKFVTDPWVEADPGLIDAYLVTERPGVELTNNVKKYLNHLGWESSPKKLPGRIRTQYKSPDGRTFMNLLSACKSLKSIARDSYPNAEDGAHNRISPSSRDVNSLSPIKKYRVKPELNSYRNADPDKIFDDDLGLIDAYLLTEHPRGMTNDVKKYLYQLGWESWSKKDGGRVRTQYKSPDGRIFYELRSACKGLKSIALDSCPNAEVSVHKLNFAESVREYVERMKNSCFHNGSRIRELRVKIKGYLSAMGWKFHHIKKIEGRFELHYESPDTNRVYITLLRACQAIAEGLESNTMDHAGGEPSLSNADAQPLVSLCSEEGSLLRKHSTEKPCETKNSSVCDVVSPLVITQQDQLHECNGVMDGLENGVNKCSSRKSKSRKLDGHGGTRVNRSRKRVQEGCPRFSQVPWTVLSWLIDNNVISSRKKVYYRNRKDLPSIGKGRITRVGIKCSCCSNVFSLSSFAAHVGSNSCQPEENLFLEDERSLFDCQMELISKNSWLMCEEPLKVESACGSQRESRSDNICSLCHYGGDLILCDLCPSAFHKDCLHLPEIPDGDWFCPSCCCGICGGSQFDVNSEQVTDISVLCCEQCERRYHAHCIRSREMVNLDARPSDKWFCSETCGKIHWGLQQLVGKPNLVGHNNLTCTILKPIHYNDSNDFDIVTMARTNSKLLVSLGVMDECFEPVKEPQTRRDIVEDVILCRRSKLKRLNFGGFFTVLLERDDELISVALLRVYGDKVAEIPLIGTRFKHRRLGMCRILMNEIEKNLINLGVEKLVLPAAVSVLNTWTTAFGFSSLTQSERSELICYTFLDFQDTVMCQKPLKKQPSSLSNLVKDKRGNSGVSEVFQEEQAEGSDSVNQAKFCNSGDKRSADGEDRGLCSPAPTVTDQPINKEISMCSTTEISWKKRANTVSENVDGYLIFYKRKKTRDPRSSSAHQVGYSKVEIICR